MKKFRFENSDIWFGYVEGTNLERAIAKARVLAEAHPEAEIIYNDDKLNATDIVSSNVDSPVVTQSAVPKRTAKTQVTEETVQLPDMSSDLDESTPNVDSLGI